MQIDRMFEIIYILIDKKTVTAKSLAERFEVSVRTIYRDIDKLSLAGIPVYMTKGKGGGISILEDYVLNKTLLTSKEKSDILSSLQAIGALKFCNTDSALQKLGSLFGENDYDWIEVDFSSWYNSKNESEIFNLIKTAILSKKIINFNYSSGKGEEISRTVEPLRLCFKGVSRYLYAYCRLRNDFRFFKFNRIKNIDLTNILFDRKVIEPIFKTDNIFNEELITLKLKISKNMAYRVFDEFDNYIIQEDGSFIVETVYPKGEWLFPYLSSFSYHCEVLEPASIRELTKQEFQKNLENYF